MGSAVWKPPSVVSLLAVLWTQTLVPFPGFQLGRSACLALAQWCSMVTTSDPRV